MAGTKDRDKRTHVLEIVGNPVGGIRKHVHTILQIIDSEQFRLSYAYSTVSVDKKFQADLCLIDRKIGGALLPLCIQKNPDISDLVNLLKLSRYVVCERVDVIHGHGAKGGLYARILAGLFNAAAIYTPHGGTAHKIFSPFVDKIYVAVEKLLMRYTGLYLCESQYTAQALQQKLGISFPKWDVNYNGVEINGAGHQGSELTNSLSFGECINLGVFGMLRPEKGQRYAIEALGILRREGINAKLHLFGEGPGKDALYQFAKEHNVISWVLFRGDVSNSEEYMRQMDIILVPSLFESFGYAAVEAMALNRPLVAARTGGLREIVVDGQTGILTEPGNARALAEAVKAYLQFPQLAVKYSANGFLRCKQLFTTERMCKVIADAYHQYGSEARKRRGRD